MTFSSYKIFHCQKRIFWFYLKDYFPQIQEYVTKIDCVLGGTCILATLTGDFAFFEVNLPGLFFDACQPYTSCIKENQQTIVSFKDFCFENAVI